MQTRPRTEVTLSLFVTVSFCIFLCINTHAFPHAHLCSWQCVGSPGARRAAAAAREAQRPVSSQGKARRHRSARSTGRLQASRSTGFTETAHITAGGQVSPWLHALISRKPCLQSPNGCVACYPLGTSTIMGWAPHPPYLCCSHSKLSDELTAGGLVPTPCSSSSSSQPVLPLAHALPQACRAPAASQPRCSKVRVIKLHL